jgi:hypothetical protein
VAYYNMGGGIGGAAGTLFGTGRVGEDAFKGNDIFGTDYYDTSAEGRYGWQRFVDVLGGNNKFQSWAQNKYPQMWDRFGAASGDDPTLTWTKFLQGQQDQMATDYSELAPSERGEMPGRSLGKLRWL